MATVQLRTDDITGETLPDDTPTTRLYIEDPRGDVSVEIDLSDTSFKSFIAGESKFALSKILANARPVTVPQKKTLGTNATETSKARAWAISHRPDLNVSPNGRVANDVIVAYRAYLDNAPVEDNSAPTE